MAIDSPPAAQTNSVLSELYAQRMQRVAYQSKEYAFERLQHTVTISEQCGAAIGAHVWDGSHYLSLFAEAAFVGETSLAGKKIIELGAGTGLTGIVAALLGGDVVITDLPDACPLIWRNVVANCSMFEGVRVGVQRLAWGNDEDCARIMESHAPDIILAADVVYAQVSFDDLLSTLVALSSPHTVTYIAYTPRDSCESDFFDSLTAAGFHYREVARFLEGSLEMKFADVYLYELRRTPFPLVYIRKWKHSKSPQTLPPQPCLGSFYDQLEREREKKTGVRTLGGTDNSN